MGWIFPTAIGVKTVVLLVAFRLQKHCFSPNPLTVLVMFKNIIINIEDKEASPTHMFGAAVYKIKYLAIIKNISV